MALTRRASGRWIKNKQISGAENTTSQEETRHQGENPGARVFECDTVPRVPPSEMRRSARQEDGIRFRFKQQYTAEQRRQEADAILQKYPQRIPVIVERAPNSHVPSIDKQKFLVPNDITVAQFMWIVRKRIHLSPEKALFVFIGRLMPQSRCVHGQINRAGNPSYYIMHAFDLLTS